MSATFRPSRAQPEAVTNPAVPPPMTTISNCSVMAITSKRTQNSALSTISRHIYADRAVARAIELDEVHPLPPPENELAVAIRPRERRSDERREEVRVGVPFAVLETHVRHQRAKGAGQIGGDV